MSDDDKLANYIAALIARVDLRVKRASAAYREDRVFVRRAAARVLKLRSKLELGEFVGPIGPDRTTPQFLLQFKRNGGQHVVLKVYGRCRPAEAIVQTAWRSRGVRVVDVLDAGDAPTSWLMLRAVATEPITTESKSSSGELVGLSRKLASMLTPAHPLGVDFSADGLAGGVLQCLEVAIGHHLGVALAALQRHGYRLRKNWWESGVREFSSSRAALLHGDLAVGNVARDSADGDLLLFDSCGYLGPPEFDAARWSARMGGVQHAEAMLSSWLDTEPGLNRDRARRLLALELVMEAGVRELVKEENAICWSTRDSETEDLITLAERIWDIQ